MTRTIAAFLLVAPFLHSADTNWVDPKTGISYGVPAGYDDVWPHIPDDARELFVKTSKGTRDGYAAAKREQLNNPQAWAAKQAQIDRASSRQDLGFKSKPVLSPEQKLRLGLDTTPNAFLGNTRYVNGALVTEIDPAAMDNIYLLTKVLAQEASMQRSLAALGREAAPGLERLRLQFEAVKAAQRAVLDMTFTEDKTKFLADIETEKKKIGKLLAGALPEVVIFGKNANETTTIADLKARAEAEAEKRPRAIADPEGGPDFIKEHPIAIVIDPDLEGNGRRVKIGIADRSGEGPNETRMTHDQIASAMGSSFSEVISGHILVKKVYDADGRLLRTDLVFDFGNHPPVLNAKVKDHIEWVRWLRELAAHPEARLLTGAGLMIQGHVRQIEPGPKLWWQFKAGGDILVSYKPPEFKSEEAKSKRYFPERPPRGPYSSAMHEQRRDEGNVGRDTEKPPTPEAPATPKAVEQGPSNPDLEARIRALLDNNPVTQLEKDVRAKDPRIFKDEVFRAGDNKERIRAFKRVMNEAKYRQHSIQLAELRREIVFQLTEELCRYHNIPIELIDSGKMNGYISDLDLTLYVPPESRGNLTSLFVMNHFERAFKALVGADHANIDLTMHDGDLFMPDPRYSTQSFEEYSTTLHEVLKGLRDKAAPKTGPDGKIIPGQDVYIDPDANRRQVQRRPLREGRVTKFTPDPSGAGAKRTTGPVSKLSWRPGGGWDIEASRLDNIRPTYDRSDRFGNLMENLDHMVKNGEDHGALAKAFMRAINEGMGSGMVNSYSDLHGRAYPWEAAGSFTPRDPRLTPNERYIRLALELESGIQTDLEASKFLGVPFGRLETVETRNMAKLRWIVRAFGLAKPAAPYWTGTTDNLQRVTPPAPDFSRGEVLHVAKLFDLIETAADMEAFKNRGEFKFDDTGANRGRSAWMRAYFEEAEKAVRKRPSSKGLGDKEFADAVYAEAWRYYCLELKDTVVKGMAVAVKRLLFDLTPDGIRRNAMQFAMPDGRVDVQAAKKLAQQRREQLALLYESIESLTRAGDARGTTPAENARAQDARILAESLRASVKSRVSAVNDGALQAQVEKLMDLSAVEFDNFLTEIAPSQQEIERILEAKEGKLRAVNEPIDMSESRKFADYMRDGILRRASAADGPSLTKTLDSMNNIIGDLLDLTAKENPSLAPRVRERYGHANSHFPGVAMIGNSLVNMAAAYNSGDNLAFREALIGEVFNYFLPPAYGVMATGLRDFGRGKIVEGIISVGTLGLFHGLETRIPGAGQVIMAFQLVNGLPKLANAIMREAITEDILEQALASNVPADRNGGLGLKRAERNPYKVPYYKKNELPSVPFGSSLLREAAKTSPPFEPVLYKYNACGDPTSAGWPAAPRVTLDVAEDQMTMAEKLPIARRLFGPEIERKIAEAGLSPEEIAASSDPVMKQGHADWLRENLEKEYAFALPYERRVARLYDCFFPKLAEKRKEVNSQSSALAAAGYSMNVDDDTLLERIFLEIVEQWFAGQSDDYKLETQYNSWKDKLNPWYDPQQNSQRIRKSIALKLVNLYKKAEMLALYVNDQQKEIQAAVLNNVSRAEVIQELAYGKRTSLVKGNQDRIEAIAVRNYAALPEQKAVTWLDTPPYYVPFSNLYGGLNNPNSPIVANVRADPKKHPGPYQTNYAVGVESCSADWQSALPGMRLSADEQKQLDQKKEDGRPVNRLLAVQFAASAEVMDAHGAKIAETGKVPVKGYLIEPASSFVGNIKLNLKGSHPQNGTIGISGKVLVNGQDFGRDKGDQEHISVYAPGSYQIEIDPGGDWGKASTTVTFTAPPENRNTCQREDQVVNTSASLTFPYLRKTSGAGARIIPVGADPKDVAACQQLITGAKQQGASNPAAAAQAQQKCAGLTPAIDQGLQGLTADLGAAINSAMQKCEFEQALQIANQGKPVLQANAQYAAWLSANLAGLEARARAQSEARSLIQQAQAAIQTKNVAGAIAALDRALAVPNLPQCMKDQIASLRGPLAGHSQFIDLVTKLIAAYDRCDVATALSLRTQIEAIQPRDQMMNNWLAQNPRATLDDWARRYQRSLDLRTQALGLWKTASTTADWDRVIATLEQARDTSLPCLRALDIERLIEEAKRRRPVAPTIPTVTERPKPPVVQQTGTLVGGVTITPDKREEHLRSPAGRLLGETTCKFTANSWRFERNNWDDRGTRTHHAQLGYDYAGVPSSVSPGQSYAITLTGGELEQFPAQSAAGYVLSGTVHITGDVDVRSAQPADRGHPSGRYEFTVRQNAKKVEIHLGGYPCGTGAIWTYPAAPGTTTSTVNPTTPAVNPPKPAGGRWKLVSTDVIPKEMWKVSPNGPKAYEYDGPQATSVPMNVYNGTKGHFQWDAPPAEFDSNGFSITLNAQAKPIPKNGMAVLICVGGNLPAEDRKYCAEANARDGVAASGSQTVKLKPSPGTGDVEVKVVLMWGAASFIYKYQLVR
ncbi:MAG: hypothetical protein HY820_34310 [Acidobacteria bacterium]|nr:hypothetical protein [Acidobacteriota bacterium]